MATWTDPGSSPVVSGSDAVTKPGTSAYSATGGAGGNTWSVVGTGCSIDQDGNLTLGDTACGMSIITCEDCCGNSDSMEIRVTNGGSYGSVADTAFSISDGNCPPGLGCPGYWWYGSWTSYAYCDGGAYSYSEDGRYRYQCNYANYVETGGGAGDACGAAGVACCSSNANGAKILATCACPTPYYVLRVIPMLYTTVVWYQVPNHLWTWTWGC